MKINKLFAGISAAALAATMCSFSTSAITEDAASIDFEDGDCSFVYMNVDDGADPSVLSVEEYDGSKQLKVDVTSVSKAPKVWFDLDKIMPREKTVTISQIDFDLTLVPKSEEGTIGWAGGAIGTAGGFDPKAAGSGQVNPSWTQGDWSCTDENAYAAGQAAKTHVSRKFLLAKQKYTMDGTNPFFGLMRWSGGDSDYVMYIDNVVFTDDAGKTITVGLPAAAETTAEETTAAPVEETTAAAAANDNGDAVATDAAPAETAAAETEAPEIITAADETEAAPAETEAAPAETAAETTAAATTEAPAKTGNTAAAAIVAVMAVAGAAAVITKKRG